MTGAQPYAGALEAVERLLNRGGDADDVLRAVVAALHERIGYPRVAVALVEEGELVAGPSAGEPAQPAGRFPIAFQGTTVAELEVGPFGGGAEERAFCERVALLVSPYCLAARDTGGAPRNEVS